MFAKHPVTSTCIDNSSPCALGQDSSVLTQTSKAGAAQAGSVGAEVCACHLDHLTFRSPQPLCSPWALAVLVSQIHFPAQKLLVTLGLGTV